MQKPDGADRGRSGLLNGRWWGAMVTPPPVTEAITMTGYGPLSEAYEWLIRDDLAIPIGAAARYDDLLEPLRSGARVLDCACGTGQLAVGLAGRGLDVVATDASEGMIRRTEELAGEHGVPLRTHQASWEELPDHFDASSFDLVFCVGNSLGHAEGATGRQAALSAMARLVRPGGRLVLTSRAWEVVRHRGSGLDIRDRLVRRNGRDAVVIYYTQIAPEWEQEHHFEIAVTQVEPVGSLRTCAERLSFWPYRRAELVAELEAVGLSVEATTFDPDGAGYLLVVRAPADDSDARPPRSREVS